MPQSTANIITDDLINEIKLLEQEVVNQLSSKVFDYIYLLSPTRKQTIQLLTPLNTKQTEVLTKYNTFVEKLLKQLSLDLDLKNKDLFNKFLEYSRSIYLIRYIEARQLFAEYALFTIPTKESKQYAKDHNESTENTISIEIKVKDAFSLEEDGSINILDTIKKEDSSNLIKSSLATLEVIFELTGKSLIDLSNITSRAFLVSLNQKFLQYLMQSSLQILVIETNKLAYNYIDRGFTPKEAYENVRKILIDTTPKHGIQLTQTLSHIQPQIEELVKTGIEDNINLEKAIQQELFKEIMELLVHYATQGLYVSKNMYQLKFIQYSELPEEYANYHNVIELYLMDDEGTVLNVPSEAYDIGYSKNFKEQLFNLVTNGIENPLLTLEDYLNEI